VEFTIEVMNRKRFEETSECLVEVIKPYSVNIMDLLERLETKNIMDLCIINYQLPFELSDNNWEMIINLCYSPYAEVLMIIEDTPIAREFRTLVNYFFKGNYKELLEDYKWIKCYGYADLEELTKDFLNFFHNIDKDALVYESIDISKMVSILQKKFNLLETPSGIFSYSKELLPLILT